MDEAARREFLREQLLREGMDRRAAGTWSTPSRRKVTELTPELEAARKEVRRKLIALREESISYLPRRNAAIAEGDRLGMSLRDIGIAVGLSYQGVSDVLKLMRDDTGEQE